MKQRRHAGAGDAIDDKGEFMNLAGNRVPGDFALYGDNAQWLPHNFGMRFGMGGRGRGRGGRRRW